LEEENEKELEATIARVEKERKKQEKKERGKKQKSELRQKMSVIASTDIYNQNDEVLFDRRTFEKLQKIDIEELGYEDEDMGENEDLDDGGIVVKSGKRNKKEAAQESSDDDDGSDSEAERVRRVDKMAAEIEGFFEQKREYKGELDRRQAKKDKKKKALVEQQRLRRQELKLEDALDN
jgi:hypothetical protein